MIRKPQLAKTLTAVVALSIFATGCTKKRDAALPEAEALQVFAIDEFATPSSQGFNVVATASAKEQALLDKQTNKASQEKGLISIDAEESSIPKRLRFMFENLEVSGQVGQDFKIVFGVDAKFVTAYKLTNNLNALSKLEKQLAVSPSEVQLSIDMQKAASADARKTLVGKIAQEQKSRAMSLAKRANINVLVPIFKYEIKSRGTLERTKNGLNERTSTLALRDSEFRKATHISIDTTSDARKDVGSIEQKEDLDQLFTTDSLDNQIQTAAELQERFKISMKFVADDAKVLTKLDSDDLKVYEITNLAALSKDEQRLVTSGRGNGEVVRCSELDASNKDQNCVLRLVAKVPVTYKNARLDLADSRENKDNSIKFEKVTKAQSQGLVEITRQVRAERARPTGMIDPLNTIKVADLAGEFYFRRTFEDASNMMVVGQSGTSGDMSVVKFELEKDRLVVRNQKALIQYIGQGPKDKEELMSVPVKYFKLEKVDADGVALQVPKLIDAKKEDAEYIEIDWTKNTIPVANSPLAFFGVGSCFAAESSLAVTDPDMRLATDGMMNFSLSGSYTVSPECANQAVVNDAYFSMNAQFNYNVIERLSFKKRTNAAVDDAQFSPNISPDAQNAMRFAAFTLAEGLTSSDVRPGREHSEVYKPIVHDFRNGKVLNYWVGGLENAPAERKALITQAAQEVVNEWNAAFHKAFKGTELDREGAYLVLNTEDDSNRGHLGDLDRNYLWFFDMPTENGLLGVAQPAPNPYSGTIMANNVMVYSGNSEKEVRGFIANYKESRQYEKWVEEAKTELLADIQKETAASQSQPTAQTAGRAGQADAQKSYLNYISKISLSARPMNQRRMSSKFTSAVAAFKADSKMKKAFRAKNVVTDVKLNTSKDATRRMIQEALSGEFKNDPIMLEAIIARELARSEQGLSVETKALLNQIALKKAMTAKFEASAKKRGGCFLYSRNEYNDKFVESSFDDLFKKEIKATLLHEVGHALGLVHNFKGSFDKENFAFEGEKTDRNYTSIMDYIAAPEMKYEGPGTYDVHALRAIYTGLIELAPMKQALAEKSAGLLSMTYKLNDETEKVVTAQVRDGKFIKLEDVKNLLNLQNWADVKKEIVNKSFLLKYYGQCHDGEVGYEPGCTRYDEGASATEIVKNEIQNYHRSYATAYYASDRLNFGWSQKVNIIRGNIERFRTIRGFLDNYFGMAVFNTAVDSDEENDFFQAALAGYDFFHEVLRIPDTNLPHGSTKDEVKARLNLMAYKTTSYVTEKKEYKIVDRNGSTVTRTTDAPVFEQKDGQRVPKTVVKDAVRLLESRSVYDKKSTAMSDRIDTIGIGFDKQFALQFLLTANPNSLTDDSNTGWIGYNEFEQYFMGVQDASQSTNMITLLEILNGTLKAGFVDENHTVQSMATNINVNRNLLDSAILGGVIDTNQYRMMGLDTFAEFFKVGTLKGGKSLGDRPAIARFGQSSQSAAGVKFFAVDNAAGSNFLVRKAAKKGLLMENGDSLQAGIIEMWKTQITLEKKIAAVKAADASLKGKKDAEIIAGNEELKKLLEAANKAVTDLTAKLNELNKDGAIASTEEIAANPNLAIETQVKMMKGVIVSGYKLFVGQLVPLINQTKAADIMNVYQALAQAREQHQAMTAESDLLAATIEVEGLIFAQQRIQTADGQQLGGSQVYAWMVGAATPLSTSQQELMYVIEGLATYTNIINPEYVY